ncbi:MULTISPECIES: type I methionyl aminopeptidase [Thermotoga]|jgi:methionyl aminopeptidase|uniref:Methionine aminopeptidase n=1 Tax=Thermotoga neapolitana (strain ATCC 49049 / DSM 4359 / NBRC 107923 / NS-E) TaxID=309803 RepID=B9K8A8_THENN|nr:MULTISPECIES: type I methionyl aminopeptidase [Thermotoga]ACM23191.1 Methionine aminopeptidase [Thermotoga neapolitana DSM 4359]AJG41104.1 methionine aminopeptidase [Thermotoga sp. RQ7]KFZ21694.1 methionine aminopeptidase, type I [Thermotoga neapolitana LA10]HBF11530.1 type I methionyl aminopeptidase [Thermotoga neapolitana]
MIRIKTPSEIEKMKRAGEAVAVALREAKRVVLPGKTAWDVEKVVLEVFKKYRVKPAFKGYNGYEYATCVSVNEEVVHGLPLKEKVFKEGDIVSIDVGAAYQGLYGDAAITYIVGETDERGKELVRVTKEALERAIKIIKPGIRLGDVSHCIQEFVESAGFNVIRDYVGHGIGRELHEDPQVPNYGTPGTGIALRKGMTLAIEPMVSEGDWRVVVKDDGWTAVTVDGSRCAHFEHTVLITEDGAEILTREG